MVDLMDGFGWAQTALQWGAMIVGLLVFAFLAWFVHSRFLDYPYTVFLEERRGNIAIPRVTKGRFEKSKEGKDVLSLQGMKEHIGCVSYADILPGNKIRLYRVSQTEFKALPLVLDESNKAMYMPQDDEQMRFAFASSLEHIWLMTQPNDLLSKWGHIVWLVVAGVMLVVILWSPMDMSAKAAAQYAGAASSFEAATENMMVVVNARPAPSDASTPPVP